MLNQVQHDIKKEPGFRKRQMMSEKIVKSSDIFDHLVILDSIDVKYTLHPIPNFDHHRNILGSIDKTFSIDWKKDEK